MRASTEFFTEALRLTHSLVPGMLPRQRMEAERYLVELMRSPEGLNLSLHIIRNESMQEVRCFWAFNTIIHHMPSLATSVDAAQAEELYRTLFSFVHRYLSAPAAPPVDYLLNKHAQLMVVGLQCFYPERWHSFFDDLFDLAGDNSASTSATVYFLRVFEYIDERVVSVRERVDRAKRQRERERDREIKDTMREKVVPQLVRSWYAILAAARHRAPEVATLCLDVVQVYIEWIDVHLVATADWINLLYYLITVPPLRIAACSCVLSLVEKKQLPGAKMECLHLLNVVDSIPRMVAMLAMPPTTDEDVAFTDMVCKLAVAVAGQLLSLLETCSALLPDAPRPVAVAVADSALAQDVPFEVTPQLLQSLSEALHAVVAQLLRLLRIDLCGARDVLLPFMQGYVKSPALTDDEATRLLHALFQHSIVQTVAPGHEDAFWDDAVVDQRRNVHNLVRLLYRRSPTLVLVHLQSLVGCIVSGPAPCCSSPPPNPSPLTGDVDFDQAEVVEAVLRYVYEVGEAVKLEVCLHDPGDPLALLLAKLVTADSVVAPRGERQQPSPMVHLAFFEVMDRYHCFFMHHQQYIPVLLQRLLLQPCGITNPDSRVRGRICCLFSHLLQVLKPCLKPYAADMVHALKSIVSSTLGSDHEHRPHTVLLSCDQREMYEAMGRLLSVLLSTDPPAVSSSTDPCSSAQLLHTVVQAALEELEHASAAPSSSSCHAAERVADAVSYLSAIAKGLGEAATMAGGVFSPVMGTIRYIFTTSPWRNSSAVREAVRQLVQQMINTLPCEQLLGVYEEYVASSLRTMGAVPELSRLLRLMYHFVNRAGPSGVASLVRMTPAVCAKVLSAGTLEAASPVMHMGVVSESARETLDVYRQLFAFLFNVGAWGCAPAVLLLPRPCLEFLFTQLTCAVTLPAELELPRSALQTLTRLATELLLAGEHQRGAAVPDDSPDVAANRAFIATCLLEGVLPLTLQVLTEGAQFNLDDAKSVLLLGDVGQFIKTLCMARCDDAAATTLADATLQTVYDALRPPSPIAHVAASDPAMDFCVALRAGTRFDLSLKRQLRELLVAVRQGHSSPPAPTAGA